MLSDLNRVDFRVVREQAAWACACGSNSTAHKLEADFKVKLYFTPEQLLALYQAQVRSCMEYCSNYQLDIQ
ncbi:jg21729 [Pararge aegeria aegeria]|uniref:Jg21729 protein n=1 Tax=Pararge aegeria aegeria TaxID=348720 RepID=A0A8S4S7T8_9NEOP|nr:jg21729 [Pararge aegeria aegeria]